MGNEATSVFPVRSYRQGAFIFRQGGPSTFGGIIATGRVAVIKEVEGEEIVLATLTKGAIVGEMALLSEKTRTASVVAMDDTELVIVERAKFRDAVASSPVMMQSLIFSLVERLAQTSERVRLQRRLPDLCLALANLLQACLDDNPADSLGRVSIPLDRMVGYSRAAMRVTPAEVEEIVQSLSLLDLIQVGQGPQGREIRLPKRGNLVEKAAAVLGPQRDVPPPQRDLAGLEQPQRRQGDKYIALYDLAAHLNTTPQTLCRMLALGQMPETMVHFPRQEAMRWAAGLSVPGECLAAAVPTVALDDAPALLEALVRDNSRLLSQALAAMDRENLLVLLSSASPAARRTLWGFLAAEAAQELSQVLGQTAGAGPERFSGAVHVLRDIIARFQAEAR